MASDSGCGGALVPPKQRRSPSQSSPCKSHSAHYGCRNSVMVRSSGSGGALRIADGSRCGSIRWRHRRGNRAGFVDARLDAFVVHLLGPTSERRRRALPFKLVDIPEQRCVGAQGRQVLEQERVVAIFAEYGFGEGLDWSVFVEQRGGGAGTDAPYARITILRIH